MIGRAAGSSHAAGAAAQCHAPQEFAGFKCRRGQRAWRGPLLCSSEHSAGLRGHCIGCTQSPRGCVLPPEPRAPACRSCVSVRARYCPRHAGPKLLVWACGCRGEGGTKHERVYKPIRGSSHGSRCGHRCWLAWTKNRADPEASKRPQPSKQAPGRHTCCRDRGQPALRLLMPAAASSLRLTGAARRPLTQV